MGRDISRPTIVLIKLGWLNERILRDYVYTNVRYDSGTKIKITGYDESSENNEGAQVVSEARARTIYANLIRFVDATRVDSVVYRGAGDTSQFYTNELPEGRRLNRTVQVVIEWPYRPAIVDW